MRMLSLFRAVATALALLPLSLAGPAGPLAAADGIDLFLGPWIGATVPGGESRRAATLLMERREGNGFVVIWSSFELVEDFPELSVIGRERSLVFEPGPRPGLWRAVPAGNVIDSLTAWATLRDDTLTITTIALTEDNRLEQQVYERVLTAEGLTLTYRRLRDGVQSRMIEARFRRP